MKSCCPRLAFPRSCPYTSTSIYWYAILVF